MLYVGKYYLVDAGYPQIRGYLGPYKGERYHLSDFRRGSIPKGKKEIFNHRHSSLRCIVETIFDVWKNRWKMLCHMHNFSLEKQVQIVIASMVLHNFIRIHSTRDKEFESYDNDDDLILEANEQVRIEEDNDPEDNSFGRIEMDEKGEKIANLFMSRS